MPLQQLFPRLFSLTLIAALLATLCDANHAFTGTLSYPAPWIAGQALWVFPGFFVAFFTMGLSYFLLPGRLPPGVATVQSTSAGSASAFVEAMAAFAFVYLMSGFGHRQPALLAAIFYGSFVIRWYFSYERAWLLVIALLLAVGGVLGEGLLSALGLVAYARPEVFHVPWWLGGLYMHGAFALREGMRHSVYGRA